MPIRISQQLEQQIVSAYVGGTKIELICAHCHISAPTIVDRFGAAAVFIFRLLYHDSHISLARKLIVAQRAIQEMMEVEYA